VLCCVVLLQALVCKYEADGTAYLLQVRPHGHNDSRYLDNTLTDSRYLDIRSLPESYSPRRQSTLNPISIGVVTCQDPSLSCWEGPHLLLASLALFCLALYLVTVTLLPPGTYKESMTEIDLDVLFVSITFES
jgi:hypothetical protein